MLQAYPKLPQPPSDLPPAVNFCSVLSPSNEMASVPGSGPVSSSALPATLCLVRSGSDSSPDTCLEQRLLSCFTYFVPGALQALVHLFPRTTCLQMKKLRQTLSICPRERSWDRSES